MTFNDPVFFEETFRTEYDYLCNLANKVVGKKTVSQDLVQNLFLKIWKNREKIVIHTSVRSYLSTSIINLAYNFLRSQKRLEMLRIPLKVSTNQTEESVAFNELQSKLDQAIRKLPAQCQTIFTLSRYEGMKNKEVASHLGLSTKTVENQIGIALKKLREEMAPYITLSIYALLAIIIYWLPLNLF